MTKVFDWLWKVLGAMPSTNARIGVTFCVFIATAARYQMSGIHLELPGPGKLGFAAWEPSLEWCALLLGAMGVDAAQYFSKRSTHKDSPPASPDVEDTPAATSEAAVSPLIAKRRDENDGIEETP